MRGFAQTRGVSVANTASISANIAGRYAQAVFDLAREQGDLDALAGQVDDLGRALAESEDLRTLISSPLYSREEQGAAIGAVADRMGLSPVLGNTLRLMARNNRLFALPQLVQRLKSLIAEARGEVTAEVVSAAALTDEQQRRLTETLAQKSGKTIKLDARVDESLIGGMIVRLGSQMIDSSIRSKLASLQNVMKEVR
nr:F0F1 ATP synthase subunit delta [Paracoccus sp. Z118]